MLNVQHGQDVIAPVPRESVLCLVLLPDELQKMLFPVTCVLKLIPAVGVNKPKWVCVFQRASCCYIDCPPKHPMEILFLCMHCMYWHSCGCQLCVSGGGFSKDRTKEPVEQLPSLCLLCELCFPWASWDWQLCHSAVSRSNTHSTNMSCESHSSSYLPQGTCIPIPTTSTSPPPSYLFSAEDSSFRKDNIQSDAWKC